MIRKNELRHALVLFLRALSTTRYVHFSPTGITFQASYDTFVLLGGYGFEFTYFKEFSFDSSKNVEFAGYFPYYKIIKRFVELSKNSNCYVTFQKKEKK